VRANLLRNEKERERFIGLVYVFFKHCRF